MIDALLKFSIARRWLVLFLVLVVAAVGLWNYQRLPIDAVRISPMCKCKLIPKHQAIRAGSGTTHYLFGGSGYRRFAECGRNAFTFTLCLIASHRCF